MSLFEKFITEGNEKADDPAKEGAMLDGGFMAQARASTVQQEKGEVYAASFHCLVEELKDCEELEPKPTEKWTFVNQKGEAKKHQTEWCATANKCRCVRCGRNSKKREDARNVCRTKVVDGRLKAQVGKMGKSHFGRARHCSWPEKGDGILPRRGCWTGGGR